MRRPLVRLAAFAAIGAALGAVALGLGARAAAAATRLYIRNHVGSNDVRALAAWNGVLAAGTTGGLVTVAMPDGPLSKILRAPGGLPSNEILSLVASPSGALWIGTVDAGIARLRPDGTFRRTLTSFDGLPSDRVQELYRTGDSLWAGTSGGVALFTENGAGQHALRRSDTSASTAGGLVSDDVRAFALVGDTLWAGTGSGLSAFVGGAWIDRRAVFAGDVNALLARGDTLWIGTASGPRAWAGGILAPTAPGHIGTTLALASHGGLLYEGTNGGVLRLANGSWSATGPGLPIGRVEALGTAPDGALWAGTQTGLARYDPVAGLWTARVTEGPAIQTLQDDRAGRAAVAGGSAWFAPGNRTAPGEGAGIVLRVQDSDWSLLTSAGTGGAMQAASVFAVFGSADGRLWIGHCCSSGEPPPRVERYDPATGDWIAPGGANVMDFAQAPDGRVYAASDRNGVYVYDGTSGALLDSLSPSNTAGSASGSGLVDSDVAAIAFDPAGIGWFALTDAGLDRWDGRGTDTHADDLWTHYATGFPSPNTTSVVALDPSTVYVGTASGVAALENGFIAAARQAALQAVLGGAAVRDLVHDGHGIVWIATSAGLGRLDDATGVVERFTTADGLVDDDVRGLAWDGARGILWVTTAHGISEVRPQSEGSPAFANDAYLYPNPAGPASGPLRVGGLSGAVSGEIRDVTGRRVRNFRADPVSDAIWDWRDASGTPAASGVYLVILRDGGRTRMLRVAVTR